MGHPARQPRGPPCLPDPEDWDATFDAVKDALLDELDDPAVTFRGFWRYDERVLDGLRHVLHSYGGVILTEPKRSE